MLQRHHAIAKSFCCGVVSLLGIVFYLDGASSSSLADGPPWEHHQTLDAIGARGDEDGGLGVNHRYEDLNATSRNWKKEVNSSLTRFSTSSIVKNITEKLDNKTNSATCGVIEKFQDILRDTIPLQQPSLRRLRRQAFTGREPTRNDGTPLTIAEGDVTGLKRYVELHVVADSSLYRHLGSRDEDVKKYCAEVISHTNAVFQPLAIAVVMTRLEIWRGSDKTRVSESYNDTLQYFKPHRIQMLKDGVNSDVSLLLTKVNFFGSTVGFALVSSMCTGSAVAVVEAHDSDVVGVSHTVSHELGHVLGMSHDNVPSVPCTCDDQDCAMASSLNTNRKAELHWSNCSKASLAAHFVNGEFSCLWNVPTSSRDRIQFCGDGVVEGIEQCDCGPASLCINQCCDAKTCTFFANATCASGPCCDFKTCQPLPASTVCRRSRSECDLSEYCSGWSEHCPSDTHVYEGAPCDDGQGHCFGGRCGSQRIRCETLFGPGTEVAPEHCFKGNVRGTEGQNCGTYRTSMTYKGCEEESVQCGSLYCLPFTTRTVIRPGLVYWRNGLECFTNYANSIATQMDVGLTPDGSSCGQGKMCVAQRCVAAPTRPEGCGSTGCGPHGVCNSKGRCHCHVGYAPPFCTTPGFGGSNDSGHATDPAVATDIDRILHLLFLLFIPLCCFVCVVFFFLNIWWETRKPTNSNQLSVHNKLFDNYCCCMSSKITMAFARECFIISGDEKTDENEEESNMLNKSPSQRRNTIFQVDVDIKTPKPEPNTWGTASGTLFTDVIKVTPKNSPDLHRKVRLPSDSPLFHHKSQDNIQRPKYGKSFSTDSGCVSDLEDSKEKNHAMSMGSLVNVFMKIGKGKRSREGSAEPELPNQRQPLTTQKSMPLSRIVLDPYGPKMKARPDSPETARPQFNRSKSSDAATAKRVYLDVPSVSYLQSNTRDSSASSNSSTDNDSVVNTGSPNMSIKEAKKPMVPSPKSKPVLPPSNAKPSSTSSSVMTSDLSSAPNPTAQNSKKPPTPPNALKPNTQPTNSTSLFGALKNLKPSTTPSMNNSTSDKSKLETGPSKAIRTAPVPPTKPVGSNQGPTDRSETNKNPKAPSNSKKAILPPARIPIKSTASSSKSVKELALRLENQT